MTIKINNEYIYKHASTMQDKLNDFTNLYKKDSHSNHVIFLYQSKCYLYTTENFIETFKNNLKLENDSRTKKEKEMGLNGKLKIRCNPLPLAEISKLEKLALISFEI
jgi:hypothetical protein